MFTIVTRYTLQSRTYFITRILLEKEMATHSSILAWRIPWTEEPGGLYSPWGHKELDMTEWLSSILYVLITFPNWPTPSTSSGKHQSVIYIYGCWFLLFFFFWFMYKYFSVWLISLRKTPSCFIHAIANGWISFFMGE